MLRFLFDLVCSSQGKRSRNSKPRLNRRFFWEILEERETPAIGLNWAFGMGPPLSSSLNQGNAIITDSGGNVLVTGSFQGTVDFDPGPGTFNLSSTTSSSIFIAKYTSAGALVWAKGVPSTGALNATDNEGLGIALDNAGNVYTTGRFVGLADFDPGPGTFNLIASLATNTPNAFVWKLDSAGNFIWARQLSSFNWSRGWAIAVDGSGNCYATGDFQGTIDVDPGPGVYNLTTGSGLVYDTFISKLDTNGNFVYGRQLAGTGTTVGMAISVDGSGNVLTTGYFGGTTDFDPGPGTVNLTGTWSIFVSKLDSAGNFLWARSLDIGTNFNMGFDMALDDGGNVYVTSSFTGSVDFDPGPGVFNLTSAGQADSFVAKLDAAGNFVWAKQLPGTQDVRTNCIALDAAGDIYFTGRFFGTVDFDPGPGTYNLDQSGGLTFVEKLDNAGNFLWACQLGRGGNDSGSNAITINATGDILVTGKFLGTADFDPGTGTYNLTSPNTSSSFLYIASLVDTANAGATIIQSGGSTDVAEGGITDTYTVVLNSVPTANVTITLNPGTQLTVTPTSLIFTPANWNTAQTVTVTAVDDSVVEGPHLGTITHTAASSDINYGPTLVIPPVTANVTDNDTAAQTLYGITSAGTLISIDPATATGTLIGNISGVGNATGLAVRMGRMYAWTGGLSSALHEIDQLTATQLSTIVFAKGGFNEGDVAFRTDGFGIVSDVATATPLYSFDITNPLAPVSTLIGFAEITPGVSATRKSLDGMAFDSSGTLFGVTESSGLIGTGIEPFTTLYTVSLSNGALTPVGSTGITGSNIGGLSFDSAGNLFMTLAAVSGDSQLYTVDRSTGAATVIGTITGYRLTGIAFGAGASVTGVTITQSAGSTAVTEGGATDTYTVVLNSAPTANVTLTPTLGSQLSALPGTLTFTTANWNVPQTVTVSASNNGISDGLHTSTVSYTATSSDTNYNGIAIAPITVNIADSPFGVTLTQSGGATNVTEGGATDSYTLVLNSAPIGNVTVTLSPDSHLTVSPGSLIFTTTNWNVPQTVNVTAVDDAIAQGPHTGTINHTAASSDAAYNGITIASVTANITDNDLGAGVTGGGTLVLKEGGLAVSYTLVLDSRPLSNVMISLNPDSQLKVSPATLTFTPLNWSLPQKVTVTAIDDTLVEGSHTGTITQTIFSGDPAYNSYAIPNVTANITDNDTLAGTENSDIIKVVPSADQSLVLVTINGKTNSVLGTSAQVPIQALGSNDTITVTTPAVPVYVDGGNGTDTLIVNGQAGNNTFVLTASFLSVNGIAITWAGIDRLTINGQVGNDILVVQGLPAFPVIFNGNSGSDTLTGPDSTNLWQINGTLANAGLLDGTCKFAAVENLTGGTGNDTFLFSAGKSVSGKIDGGQGNNILDYSLFTTAMTINLQTSTATGMAGFQNITTVLGGKSTLDKLLGPNQATTWNITGSNAGTVNGLSFIAIENLTGGSGNDTFAFAAGQGITGKVDGGAGNDLLDYTAYTTPVSVNLALKKATGTMAMANVESVQGGNASPNTLTGPIATNTWALTGSNTGTVASGLTSFAFTGMDTLIGGSGADTFTGSGTWTGKIDGGLGIDTLVGNDSDHAWNLTGLNTGTLDGRAFAGMENLRGGTGNDTFALAAGQKITGKLDGGAGNNALDYSSFTTAVTINLQLKTATNTGGFSNIGQFTGGSSSLDTLLAANLYNNWNLTGNNAGDITSAAGTWTFAGFDNLTGGSSTDLFNLTTTGSWTGLLNGGLGLDTLTAFTGSTWTSLTVNGNKFIGIETRQ